jgi:hypothetical protein
MSGGGWRGAKKEGRKEGRKWLGHVTVLIIRSSAAVRSREALSLCLRLSVFLQKLERGLNDRLKWPSSIQVLQVVSFVQVSQPKFCTHF